MTTTLEEKSKKEEAPVVLNCKHTRYLWGDVKDGKCIQNELWPRVGGGYDIPRPNSLQLTFGSHSKLDGETGLPSNMWLDENDFVQALSNEEVSRSHGMGPYLKCKHPERTFHKDYTQSSVSMMRHHFREIQEFNIDDLKLTKEVDFIDDVSLQTIQDKFIPA